MKSAKQIRQHVKISDSLRWTNNDISRNELNKLKIKHHLHGLKYILENDDLDQGARNVFETFSGDGDVSNTYCYQNATDSQSETENEDEEEYEEFQPTHFPTVPCCLVIVSHGGYVQQFENAVRKLQSDGLVFDTTLDAQCDKAPSTTPSSMPCTVGKSMQDQMEPKSHT